MQTRQANSCIHHYKIIELKLKLANLDMEVDDNLAVDTFARTDCKVVEP